MIKRTRKPKVEKELPKAESAEPKADKAAAPKVDKVIEQDGNKYIIREVDGKPVAFKERSDGFLRVTNKARLQKLGL